MEDSGSVMSHDMPETTGNPSDGDSTMSLIKMLESLLKICEEIFPIMTAWMTRNILDKDLNIGMPTAIIDTIIIPCITEKQLPKRRNVNMSNVKDGQQSITDNSLTKRISHSSLVNIGNDSENDQEGVIMTQDAQLPILIKELMEDGIYVTVCNIAKSMGKDMLTKCVYPSITTVKQYHWCI